MRVGTRGSALALAQAQLVAELLGGDCEIVPITTSGDRGGATEDKSRWVAELEQALLEERVEIAVHSAKDLPGVLADGLALQGAPLRAGAADVLCGAASLDQLTSGARVGTSSVRRRAQLRSAREDIEVVEARGNVDTRLRKLADPAQDLQALVLARAGLERLGREEEIGATLEGEGFVPAPGQGVLALECREQDARTTEAVQAITDPSTFACLLAERALAAELQASCHTPLGAHAAARGDDELCMRAWVGLPDGSAWVADELHGSPRDPVALGRELAGRMRLAGAQQMLTRAEEMAGVARR